MFRTAKPFTRPLKTICRGILLILALCLVAHFLLEDFSLQPSVDPAAQSRSTTELAFDEVEHQDDLVKAVDLPESIPPTDPPAIPAWNVHVERQSAFPIRIPPKVV